MLNCREGISSTNYRMYVPIITTDVVINLKMVTLVACFSFSVEYIHSQMSPPHSTLSQCCTHISYTWSTSNVLLQTKTYSSCVWDKPTMPIQALFHHGLGRVWLSHGASSEIRYACIE